MDTSSGYIRNLISKKHRPVPVLSKDIEGSILIVGVDEPDCESLTQILRSAGHRVEACTLDAAADVLKQDNFDLLIAGLAEMEIILGFMTSRNKVAASPKLIALLDAHSPDKVVEMMKLGVGDCIPRPLHRDYTLLLVKRALEHILLIRQAEEGERYKRISKLDSLTELYNHRHYHELLSVELERAVRDHAPITVMMLDVDKFKAYNDTNRHLAGDGALKQIASILSSSVRSYDVVARYGGEEFALMLPGTDGERGLVVAKRLVTRIDSASFPNEESLPERRLTVSVGVASYPLFGRDKDTLIRGADTAMYAAKSQGGNTVCVASEESDKAGAIATA